MSNVVRALSVSLILILSSLAGCLTDDEITDASGDDLDELLNYGCLLYTSPSPRDATLSRMPSSA